MKCCCWFNNAFLEVVCGRVARLLVLVTSFRCGIVPNAYEQDYWHLMPLFLKRSATLVSMAM